MCRFAPASAPGRKDLHYQRHLFWLQIRRQTPDGAGSVASRPSLG
ncbi:hypothetical protein ACP6QU_000357 [Cronobacter dublinensis]|nr:hypothetical protein [Cronobacter dublinensis]MDI7270983.1 hypothetical protein [Cronobacter dublinensis]MDI7395195.1 hypothetical protein [Cronobacter dublinensis]MDI7505910.1 hypothetical protein [Cronobacter dublinensis]MDT3664547.1 hypothetical protein [Cronobacter dublinensis]